MSTEEERDRRAERDKREKEFMTAGAVVGGVIGLIIGLSTPADQLPLGWIGATVAMAILGGLIALIYEEWTQRPGR